MDQSGWEGLLDVDETVVWQGRPDQGFHIPFAGYGGVAFGIFFAGFALFWMAMAMQAGGFFWMFGLIHFSAGVGIISGGIFGSTWKRRHSWYTLTTRRAFIAMDYPIKGRVLKSYPIEADTVVTFEAGPPDTIYFASRRKRTKNGYKTVPVGFQRIDDGTSVYRHIRDIQQQAK